MYGICDGGLGHRRFQIYSDGSPAFRTVRAVSSFAILFLFESSLCLAAKGVMAVLCIRQTLARDRINVGGTILLPTRPTPGPATPLSHMEFVLVVKSTRKDIVARCIFESPAATPRTGFGVVRAGFRHLFCGRKDWL